MMAVTFGRGVIASDLPYFRGTLALEPDAGVLFPVGSVDGLCSAIRTYFACPPQERGLASRRIADRFAWDRCVEGVLQWYRKQFPALAHTTARAEAG